MDEIKESIHHTAIKFAEEIQKQPHYDEFYSNVQRLVSEPEVKVDDFNDSLLKSMKESGLETELRNDVYHWLRCKRKDAVSYPPEHAYLRKSQLQWDKRVHKSLHSMCSELGMHLAKLRLPSDKDEIKDKWNELSTYDVDIHQYRPVYAPKDFLEVILNLKPPNNKRKSCKQPQWEFSHLPIRVNNLNHLRTLFVELSRGEPLLGVNPNTPSMLNFPTLEAERTSLGEKVLSTNHAPVAQEYLKKGCPRSLRAKLWSLVLGSRVKPSHYMWFENLKISFLQTDLMVDKLIIKDVHLTASNDDQYFVFEDVLFQVMLCFFRDSEILTALGNRTHMEVAIRGKQGNTDNTIIFPPSGIVPFHGFTMYASPFCYIYDDPVALYFTFRAFYVRYWFRLHRVCAHPQGIVSLCLLYERLLQSHEPELWHHFKNIKVHPVKVVFKWLMRGFSGYLSPEQLLYLWDLVLAYDSLEVMPLLAVTILSFRRDNLMQVHNLQNIETVLADLSSISVIPLLQMALLRE